MTARRLPWPRWRLGDGLPETHRRLAVRIRNDDAETQQENA